MNLLKVTRILQLIEQEVRYKFAERPDKWVMVRSDELSDKHLGIEVKVEDVKNNRYRGTLEVLKDRFIEVQDEVKGKVQIPKGNIKRLVIKV